VPSQPDASSGLPPAGGAAPVDDTASGHPAGAHAAAPDGTGRRRALTLLVTLAVVVVVLDQLTKAWALRTLSESERVTVVGDLLGLQLVFNPGAALSIATGMTWVLTLVATGVVVVVARAARRIGSTLWAVALGLLLGGAIGNLVDRFAREPGFARGHVVDFIAYADWFVGNVADIAIVVAAVLLVLAVVRGERLDGTRDGAEPEPAPAAGVDEDR
jgi:signal peptidase II